MVCISIGFLWNGKPVLHLESCLHSCHFHFLPGTPGRPPSLCLINITAAKVKRTSDYMQGRYRGKVKAISKSIREKLDCCTRSWIRLFSFTNISRLKMQVQILPKNYTCTEIFRSKQTTLIINTQAIEEPGLLTPSFSVEPEVVRGMSECGKSI